MKFEPANERYKEVVQESFARQEFMKTLGVSIASIAPGEVILTYGNERRFSQQHGFVHAGTGTAVVDTACGYASLSLANPGYEVLTVEFKNNFLRPADGKEFEAIGRVIKPGRTLVICEGELWQDGRSRLIARMQATMILITGQVSA